jgi:hypothetical protein
MLPGTKWYGNRLRSAADSRSPKFCFVYLEHGVVDNRTHLRRVTFLAVTNVTSCFFGGSGMGALSEVYTAGMNPWALSGSPGFIYFLLCSSRYLLDLKFASVPCRSIASPVSSNTCR